MGEKFAEKQIETIIELIKQGKPLPSNTDGFCLKEDRKQSYTAP